VGPKTKAKLLSSDTRSSAIVSPSSSLACLSFPGERDDGGDDTIDPENATESDHGGGNRGDHAIDAKDSTEGDDVMHGDYVMEVNIVRQLG
jgi:hypothetical protein